MSKVRNLQMIGPASRHQDDGLGTRLRAVGPAGLTDAELLGVVLGGPGLDGAVRDRAEQVLQGFRGLARLAEASRSRLERLGGFGPADAARLVASFELGRRIWAALPDAPVSVEGPEDAARLLVPLLRPRRKEVFVVLCLDTRGRCTAIKEVSVGSLSASIVHPRELFAEAILESAASVIVAHNHPSGDPTPSPEDLAVTSKLVAAGEILGIPVLDHLVVGASCVRSAMEPGR